MAADKVTRRRRSVAQTRGDAYTVFKYYYYINRGI